MKFARVQCSCQSPIRYVNVSTLRNGGAQSCGCLHKERVTKHGQWSNPLFKVWKGMVSRCTNPKDKRYERYGGRGITVCDRWLDANNFISDMTAGYEKGLKIERKNNDSGYEPSNCEWASAKTQNRNYSRNIILTFEGKSLCAADWATEIGISEKVIYDRIARGWSTIRTLTTKVMGSKDSSHIARVTRWAINK